MTISITKSNSITNLSASILLQNQTTLCVPCEIETKKYLLLRPLRLNFLILISLRCVNKDIQNQKTLRPLRLNQFQKSNK